MDGDAAMNAMIASVRRLPELAVRAAPDAADACHEALQKSIAAGTTPDGKPWAPRKADGGKPLADAGNAVAVVAVGSRVFFRVRGYIARHHLGRAKGGVSREVIPTAGIPAPMAAAIRRVLGEAFRELTGGR